MFVNHYALGGNKVKKKSYFKHKGRIPGHKVIGLCVIWKGIISGVSMPNMNFLSPCQKWIFYLIRFKSYSEGLSWQ